MSERLDRRAVNVIGVAAVELRQHVRDVIAPSVADRIDGDLDFHVRVLLVEALDGVLHRRQLGVAAERHQAEIGRRIVGHRWGRRESQRRCEKQCRALRDFMVILPCFRPREGPVAVRRDAMSDERASFLFAETRAELLGSKRFERRLAAWHCQGEAMRCRQSGTSPSRRAWPSRRSRRSSTVRRRQASDVIARVERAIAEIGYTPQRAAQTLRSGRSRLIGVIVPDITNPHFSALARVVENECLKAGYMTFVYNTDEDTEHEMRILRMMRMQQVAGLILISTRSDARHGRRLLTEINVPVVTMGSLVAGYALRLRRARRRRGRTSGGRPPARPRPSPHRGDRRARGRVIA